MFPDRLVPFEQFLAAPNVVDQHIEAALLGTYPVDQLAHVFGNQMVDLHSDAMAALR